MKRMVRLITYNVRGHGVDGTSKTISSADQKDSEKCDQPNANFLVK